MNVIFLYLEPGVMKLVESTWMAEGYSITSTASATEAIRTIEETSDSYRLIADNFHLSPEAQQTFTRLHNRPDLRGRVKTVGVSAMSQGADKWIAGLLIDDHVCMPFLWDQLLDSVEAYAGYLPQ